MMAGFKNGTIKFDCPRAVFFPGQEITGSVEIVVEQPITISVIYVKFLGEANVNWTERETEMVNGVTRYRDMEYVGREKYFEGSQLLYGAYGEISILNPGTYTYPFQYRIPLKAPSSFKGERGAVQYFVICRVEFQGQSIFKDEIIKYFDLVAPFDLNKGNECVKEPIEMEFEEDVGCGCFCSSDPLVVRVRIPVSGYCPGQAIPVGVDVENRSSVEVTNITLDLLTRRRFRTQRPIAEYVPPEEVMTSVKRGSIMSGNKRKFVVDLVVPDIVVPNLEDCAIIDVGYFFRITIKLSGCNDDLQDEAELCLGLIPLVETLDGAYVHPMAHCLPVNPQPVLPRIENVSQEPVQNAAPKMQDGTSYVQVNHQVTSSDPSQNYQLGFKMPLPPGSEPPPSYNQVLQQFPQLNQPGLLPNWGESGSTIQMEHLNKNVQNVPSYPPNYVPARNGYPAHIDDIIPINSYPPPVPNRPTTPTPSAPPM